jgi:hypothetical protein
VFVVSFCYGGLSKNTRKEISSDHPSRLPNLMEIKIMTVDEIWLVQVKNTPKPPAKIHSFKD